MIFPLHILQAMIVLALQVPSVFTDVTWNSPAAGDVYIPGDTLQAVWTSIEKIISPSFTMCSVGNSTNAIKDADCGTAVWPLINQNGTEYSISLAVPNITGDGDYYLAMKDDEGTMYDTPNFSLARKWSRSILYWDDTSQSSVFSAVTKVANTTSNSNATSSSGPTEATGTGIEYLPSHPAPTIAAIAVPLSLVAATLLIALLLLLCRMRRSRQRERDKDRESEKAASQQSTISFASATDIERAVLALAAARGYGGFVPSPYGPPQPPGAQNLGAAAAAALGMGAFGWAHGYGQAPPISAAPTDAYTPAPVPQHITSSITGTNIQRDPSAPPRAQALPSHPQHICCGQESVPHDAWCQSRSSVRRAPQLPEIHVHASSPPLYVPDSPPPPLPPKQLFPGSPLSQPPRVYEPLYSSPPRPHSSTSSDPPGTDAHASMSVISDYMQASPALPQGNLYLAPPPQDHLAPRVPPASLTRLRSLRRLETVSETGKPLPARPEDGVGTYLYDAVMKAVRR